MAEEIKETKREAFRKRIADRKPDLNLDDEDAYYGYMGDMMDEYDSYRESSEIMRRNLETSPALTDMLTAARGKKDFDPVIWMVEYEGLDIDALRDDPDYLTKLTEARNKWLAQRAKKEETDKQIEVNIPKSIAELQAKRDELGLSDEQASSILAEIFQMGGDLEVGIVPIRIFELMAKGMTRDADVEAAREEGVAEGLNTKVTDKLRTMPKTTEQVGGRQMPVREAKPKSGVYNPFKDED
jgi:hypothetical protein